MVNDQKCKSGTANYDTNTKEGGCLAAKSLVSTTGDAIHLIDGIDTKEIDTTSGSTVRQRSYEGIRLQNLQD
jgi:hypothetical protein